MNPILYIVSVPIGNNKDISMNAIEKLAMADLIIGEEFKETSKLLKLNGLDKSFELLNEHSTHQDIDLLIEKVLSSRISCLISDSGTPSIEDPGEALINICIRKGVELKIIPGATALASALALSGFRVSPFTFVGFLNRDEKIRREEILKFFGYQHTLVFYETPYRYKKVIMEMARLTKRDYRIFLGLNLTADDEIQIRGTLKQIANKLENLPKAPPVIVIEI
jgi:16S rRNA (cytidine1402-2'-O)-methyltransferase